MVVEHFIAAATNTLMMFHEIEPERAQELLTVLNQMPSGDIDSAHVTAMVLTEAKTPAEEQFAMFTVGMVFLATGIKEQVVQGHDINF